MRAAPEEVNAWGSYDQTAKTPRALPTRRDSSSSNVHRRVERKYSLPPKMQLEVCEEGRRMNQSEHGMNFAKHFGDSVIEKLDGKKEGSGKGKPSETDSLNLPEKAKMDILDIFSVYFEESHDIDPTQNNWNNEKHTLWSFLAAMNATMPWLQCSLKKNVRSVFLRKFLIFTERCLRGISQVYFQNNPFSGLLVLIGMLIQSTRVAIHGLIAVVSGNLVAYLFGFDTGLLKSGLFGYNAFLVGLAIATFDSSSEHREYSLAALIFTIFASSFSSVLLVTMGKLLVPYKSPPLTLPFNVVTLMFLLATASMTRVTVGPVRQPALPDYSADSDDSDVLDAKGFFAGTIRGIGQVYLANNIAAGVLVLFSILVSSRIAAVAALAGSAFGGGIAVATGVPAKLVEQGLYGFNSSLSVTAMFMFYVPSPGAGILGLFAGSITVIGQQALAGLLEPFGLPVLTLPFCVVALPFIIVQGTTNTVISVPLASMTTPEDHLRRFKMIADGFHFLKDSIHSASNENLKYGRAASKYRHSLSNALIAESDADATFLPSVSFSRCAKQDLQNQARIHAVATAIFELLDDKQHGQIGLAQFRRALQESGLRDNTGLRFASLVFVLLDLDRSKTIDQEEFIAFAFASVALRGIRRKISDFFHFVDVDNNSFVDFDELNAAREYLGLPVLTEADQEALTNLEDVRRSDYGNFEIVDLINFVTVANVKSLVSTYHSTTETDATSSATIST